MENGLRIEIACLGEEIQALKKTIKEGMELITKALLEVANSERSIEDRVSIDDLTV